MYVNLNYPCCTCKYAGFTLAIFTSFCFLCTCRWPGLLIVLYCSNSWCVIVRTTIVVPSKGWSSCSSHVYHWVQFSLTSVTNFCQNSAIHDLFLLFPLLLLFLFLLVFMLSTITPHSTLPLPSAPVRIKTSFSSCFSFCYSCPLPVYTSPLAYTWHLRWLEWGCEYYLCKFAVCHLRCTGNPL